MPSGISKLYSTGKNDRIASINKSQVILLPVTGLNFMTEGTLAKGLTLQRIFVKSFL
jgi:hypothetical protein